MAYDFLKQPSKIFWRAFTTTDDLNEFFQHEQIILIKWKRLHYNKPSSFSKKLKGEKKIFLNFPPFALRPGKTFLLHSSGRNKEREGGERQGRREAVHKLLFAAVPAKNLFWVSGRRFPPLPPEENFPSNGGGALQRVAPPPGSWRLQRPSVAWPMNPFLSLSKRLIFELLG